MFETFTERARQVVVLAQDEARNMRSPYVGSEHLLLGLLREEEGVAALVLGRLAVDLESVRVEAIAARDEVTEEGDEYYSRQLPYTPRAKKVLEMALREALSLGHNYIGTEHLLLGLLRVACCGAEILDGFVAPEEVREEVVRLLSGPRVAPVSPVQPEDTQVYVFEMAPADDEDEYLVADLVDAIARAVGWMTVEDYNMAYETLQGALSRYAD